MSWPPKEEEGGNPGVISQSEEKGPARISRVTVQTEEAGRALGRNSPAIM